MSEAASRIIEGAREALAIAKGEQPAASMTINTIEAIRAFLIERKGD